MVGLPELTKDLAWDEWMPQLHISRDSFRMLVYLIESHPVFSNNSPCQQLSVWDQLVVFLMFMVLPGDTDATLASDMGLGVGTISKVVGRVTSAILSFFDDYVKWPSSEERRNIASNTALPGCIGFLDGTHSDLKFRPQFQTETFVSYKKRYSISAQIAATSDGEITFYSIICIIKYNRTICIYHLCSILVSTAPGMIPDSSKRQASTRTSSSICQRTNT
jgi:hypothetical protein